MTVRPDVTPADPAGQAGELSARVDAATQRLLRTAAALSDEQARAASLLPGWSRGHVLTHLARNADSLRNLLIWARTGVETPQYPSQEARESGVAAGAGRPPAELLADLQVSAAAFAAEAGRLADADWLAEVHGIRGASHPAWYTLWRRLTEVEVHHVDLEAGYGQAAWPADFAAWCLERAVSALSGPDSPAVVLQTADSGDVYRIGPADAQPACQVSGPTRQLLAWLIGRSAGDELIRYPAGRLPSLPAW